MEEGERREAAIASAASLQPNFTPKKSNITPSQLSKFHELHKRRLKIKAKSKTKTKIKGPEGNGKSHENGSNGKERVGKASGATTTVEGSSVPFSNGSAEENSSVQESVAAHPVSTTKRQKKLHWGLDTKERWEMKANM
ncbi:uncharacterized protein [Coffea arabica]|uniref:Uncharacterized protein n=1 Tax=Coffea arabica TaxID=13443 RepID=A0A6P6TKD5_COFAR|nr:uncharacterized protein LOC113701493 [Coffea arabica]